SRQTIQSLAAQSAASCIRIFDVNLRAPFYSAEVLQESLELATVVKMNAAEASLLLDSLGLAVNGHLAGDAVRMSTEHLLGAAERLLREFPALRMVAITRGSHGSLLVNRDEWDEHPGFSVKVADAIGSGDAFTAAIA